MKNDPIPRVIAKLFIPFILVFALYIQFHGDYGPGGGFQAGVIFSGGIILYSLIFGISNTQNLIPPVLVEVLSAIGVLLYGGVGVVCILKGGEFLNYSVLLNDSVSGQHLGILLIEFGVFITVASVMLKLFYLFASRSQKL
ncbi:MAG: cation:proton antiporter [Betaproteobacteria bacterium TMED41]|nr:MAG: cation:proton antiporter [Betaproteobacteria bacterium TMED41]|tara:strand:- start:2062 stop:2484 length:423 start_codon:yes stop_codon:yes gene_type:complete